MPLTNRFGSNEKLGIGKHDPTRPSNLRSLGLQQSLTVKSEDDNKLVDHHEAETKAAVKERKRETVLAPVVHRREEVAVVVVAVAVAAALPQLTVPVLVMARSRASAGTGRTPQLVRAVKTVHTAM